MENITISMIVGAVLSAVFEFVPGIKTWWESRTQAQRGYLSGLFIAIASVGVVLYQCYVQSACPPDWVQAVLEIILPLFVGNQLSYKAIGKPFGRRS